MLGAGEKELVVKKTLQYALVAFAAKKESPQRLRRCGLLDWLPELYGFANVWGRAKAAR